jgi:hypothetical protein
MPRNRGATGRSHQAYLASDAFEGRAPGTEGEDRTIAYIVGEWAKAGLEAVPGSTTPWLQPVPFVETQALSGTAKFKVNGRDFALEDDGIILTGRDPSVALTDVPAIFVGYGVDGAGKVNADVKGKLAIMLFDSAPFGDKLPRYRERRQLLADAGASAVLVIATDAVPWAQLRESAGSKAMRLADAKQGAPVTGFLSLEAADALLKKAGEEWQRDARRGKVGRLQGRGAAGDGQHHGASRLFVPSRATISSPSFPARNPTARPCCFWAIGIISAFAEPKATPTASATARSTMRAASRC